MLDLLCLLIINPFTIAIIITYALYKISKEEEEKDG